MLNCIPKMIIFDVGGTLLDDGKCDVVAGFEQLRLAALNPEITTAEELAFYWNEFCFALSDVNLEIPLSSVIKYASMNTGLLFDISVAEQEEIFDRYNSTRTVIDGVSDLLKACDSLGIRTAVISNNMMSGESLDISLKHWIPESKFEFCLSSADLLFKKPQKFLFETALKFADVNPSDCIYCGDNFLPDVKGSTSCGMNALLLDRKSEIDFEIRDCEKIKYIAVKSWREFESYLKAL